MLHALIGPDIKAALSPGSYSVRLEPDAGSLTKNFKSHENIALNCEPKSPTDQRIRDQEKLFQLELRGLVSGRPPAGRGPESSRGSLSPTSPRLLPAQLPLAADGVPSGSAAAPAAVGAGGDQSTAAIASSTTSPAPLPKKHSINASAAVASPSLGVPPPASSEDRASVSVGNWRQQFLEFFQPSDNKLAMKLFGTRGALLKEKHRQRETGHWVIHPCSNFRCAL